MRRSCGSRADRDRLAEPVLRISMS